MEAGILLVLDRLDDLAPALLHGGLRGSEYLPWLVDLFDYDPSDTLEFMTRQGKDREMLLDDSDPVWRCIRHEAWDDVRARMARGREYYNARQAEEAEGGGEAVGASFGSVMRDKMMELITEENTCAQKLKEHVSLMNTVLWKMESGRDIMEAGLMGLTLTTGLSYPRGDSSSKGARRVYDSKRNAALDGEVKALLSEGQCSEEDKARLVALVLLCYESVDKKLSGELLDMLKPEWRRALENLEDLHVPLTRKSGGRADGAPFLSKEHITKSLEAYSACTLCWCCGRVCVVCARERERECIGALFPHY